MPSFVFRIDEIRESTDVNKAILVDAHGNWMPSSDRGSNVRPGGGASYNYYVCNDERIIYIGQQLPQGAVHYSTYSMYYVSGAGFWVLKGDATLKGESTDPIPHETWQPLRFDWDEERYSSFLTNAGPHSTLLIQRDDQTWPRMLLPDIYHSDRPRTEYNTYGWLRGELPIFLALLAFSVKKDWLHNALPTMFEDGRWKTHLWENGRTNQRGVVVYVYTCPELRGISANGSTTNELLQLEDGSLAHYYY